jgi:hypothetical protein
VSCATPSAAAILERIKAAGLPEARIIGRTEAGAASIKVV